MTKDELRQKANDLPLAPGVYLMMDKTGKVIYVGKAKKLKNRVSQYFQDTASHNEKTRAMVSQVDHFDTIFVSTEFEALILENSLIKRHMPRYNILLKDDKGYPFVRLDADAAYPRFSLVGKTADDGAKYFGPFGGRRETRLAIEAVCGALHLPTCARQFPRDIGRERPCLNHHIGRCDGFCRGGPDAEEYQKRIEQACSLLSGHYKTLARELKTEMEHEAEQLHFEQAAVLRDRIAAIEVLGNNIGNAMFFGPGAGGPATASAVLGDVVDIVRNPGRKQPVDWSAEPADLTDPDAFEASFFLRTKLDKAACEQALGEIRWLPDQNGFHGGFTGKTCRKAIAASGLALDAVWPVLA